MDREGWKAVALIVGTQIGAGVLGLPYAIKGLGFFWGATAIFTGGILMLLTALFLLEAFYRTNPHFHLFDLMEYYFGRLGAIIFWILLVVAAYGALSAYLDGMSEALYHLFSVPVLWTGLFLWLLLTFIVLKGLKLSSTVESAAVVLLLLLFLVTILWALPYIHFYHVPLSKAGYDVFFTAMSIAIFAYFMHLIVPEVIRLTKSKRTAAEAIYTAFIITITTYILFSLAVIGVLGKNTPEISVFGLVKVFGSYFAPIAYLIPLFTMFTSFIGVSLGAADMTKEFLRRRDASVFLVVLPPVIFFLLGTSFFSALFIGSVALVLAGGIIPSILAIKMKRSRLLPYRKLVAEIALFIFSLVLLWDLLPLH